MPLNHTVQFKILNSINKKINTQQQHKNSVYFWNMLVPHMKLIN